MLPVFYSRWNDFLCFVKAFFVQGYSAAGFGKKLFIIRLSFLAMYTCLLNRQLLRLLFSHPLHTNGALSSLEHVSSVLTKLLVWVCKCPFTSLDTVVALFPMRFAMDLKVIPLLRHSWISILSCNVMCLFFSFFIVWDLLFFSDLMLPLFSSHSKCYR